MSRIAFATDGWGFGTTTLLATIAHAVGARAERVLVCPDAVASLSLAAFEEIRAADVTDPEAVAAALDGADAVVSCMSVAATVAAERRSLPCAYVDGLGWMWDGPYGGSKRTGSRVTAGRTVVRYFVERFPRIEEIVARWPHPFPPVEVIGPIVDDPLPRHAVPLSALVNFGGLDSWLMPDDVRDAYTRAMCEVVTTALQDHGQWTGVFVGGAAAIARLEGKRTEANVRFATLSRERYARELSAAGVFITAAGLRATYEAFRGVVPTTFLVPQNLSQELTIRHLAESAANARAIGWRDIYGLERLEIEPQSTSCARINEAILRFAQDSDARAATVRQLAAFLADPHAVTSNQSRFFADLGEPGAASVASFAVEMAG
jgi:hypothetical protein